MPSVKILKSVISEYGGQWLVNRSLYSMKLKTMSAFPVTERIYEKKTSYPTRTNLFQIDTDKLKSFLKERLSDGDKKNLINIADKACEGIITGFSSIELNYGNPINWQLNPLTGKQCDVRRKWYKILDFDEGRGDIKVIWEASRFSHFVTLARAYLLTEDEKYYKAFSNQLEDWLKKNPYSYGANFKCSQECSLRMVNTLLSYSFFDKCGITTDQDEDNIKDLIDRCYRKVLSNFFYAYRCIKNNHTISELMGMIVGAWCCEDDKQLGKAYKWLDEVIYEQFTEDGGYRQFSFNYQRLALQDIEVVLSIETKTGRELNKGSKKRIKKAAELMYQCQDESGDMPNYGSNDGALAFPVTSCGYRDFSPVINATYALTAGHQLYDNGKHQEELIWFSPENSLDECSQESIEKVSKQYPDAGLFILRGHSSWSMIIANDYNSRPAHMDQLHFDLWINGVNVFCDTGTYSYASETGRKLVRNESHNTAQVEAATQMNTYGPFMILDWTKRKIGKSNEYVFEGTVLAGTGYKHKRRVLYKNNDYFISDIVDRDAYILFHTPCDVELNGKGAVITYNGKKLCVLECGGKESISETKTERSLYYLKGEKISCIAIRAYANKKINTAIKIERELKND